MKKIKLILFIIIIILISLFVIFLIQIFCIDNTDKLTQKDFSRRLNLYLRNNKENINIYENSDVNILNDNIDDSTKLILFGISHGVEINNILDYIFFKSLINKNLVNYYIGEFDFVTGFYLNKYLKIGDQEILKLIFSANKDSYFATEDNFIKWDKICSLYRELPENNKVVVLGIDVIGSIPLTFHYLNYNKH